MKQDIFQGVITALITPLKHDRIDYSALEKLIEHQIKGGIKALVIAGSTGESASLTNEEYADLIRNSVEIAGSRAEIIACAASSSTRTSVDMATKAEKLGAKALMCTTPAYNKPTQVGLYQHYKEIHDATNLPVMLYANPSRACVDFTDDTIFKLAEMPRIVAMKDGGGDLERPLRLSSALPKNFALLAGDDGMAMAFYAHGGCGLISVASNLVPSFVLNIWKLWNSGKFEEALTLQQRLTSLCSALFIETNPTPVKYAAALMGLCEAEVRLPLVQPSENNKALIKKIFGDFIES